MAEPTNPTTNVPAPSFTAAGFVAPTEQAILTGVTADINAAFGGFLNPALTTPQGQLASSMAAMIGQANDTFVYFTSQVDPAYAAGRMQDAIGRIYFMTRNAATPTSVQCTCSGLPGVVIPFGAQALAQDGNLYSATLGGVIGNGGTVSLPFACNTAGPIACPANSVTQIFTTIPGWSSITNQVAGITGSAVESRAAFELRRQQSVASNSAGFLSSILGAVLAVPGVLDAYVTENVSNGTVSVGGVTLNPNSVYVAAIGGNVQQVATAIWSKKPPGVAYTGNTTVTVYDSNSGYNPPIPSYAVTYEIPTPIVICAQATLVSGPTVPSNATTLVQNAILNAFAGGDGGPRARIGMELLASRFYVPVASLGAWSNIFFIAIGSPTNSPNAFAFTGTLSAGILTVTSSAGTLTAGMLVFDGSGAIAAGSLILAQLSGTTGGAGTYQIANTQSITGVPMIAILPNQDFVHIPINNVPTLQAANIIVNLLAPQ